jgi:hypothetical protein
VKLFTQMIVISIFLRAAWMKWFPPMAKRSPSPLYTTTFSFGFASLRPVANGIGRRRSVKTIQFQVSRDPAGTADPDTTLIWSSGYRSSQSPG